MSSLPLWFRLLRSIILIITSFLLLLILSLEFFQTYDVNIESLHFDLEKIEKPVKIAFLSDIQYNQKYGSRIPIREAVNIVNAENPDVLIFLGDFLNDGYSLEPLINRLKKIDPEIDCYAVLGNWDYDEVTIDTALLVNRLESIGIRVLINELLPYKTKDGEILQIAGLDQAGFKWRYPGWAKLMSKLNKREALLAVTHFPSAILEIEAFGYKPDLIVSGDTHGGQLRLPLFDIPLYAANKYNFFYSAGLYNTEAGLMYVNRGLGLSKLFPYRINNPPEITFITLY